MVTYCTSKKVRNETEKAEQWCGADQRASCLIYVCDFIVILFLCLTVNLAFSELLFFSVQLKG